MRGKSKDVLDEGTEEEVQKRVYSGKVTLEVTGEEIFNV